MATGLKPVTSAESEGSTFVVSGRLTGNGTTFSGDGWTATHTAGDEPYIVTVTNASSIFTCLTSHSFGTEAAMEAVLDTANIGRGLVKTISGNVVTLTVYDEIDLDGVAGAKCPLETDEYLDFVIFATHFGK
jgi:hypothetical protein